MCSTGLLTMKQISTKEEYPIMPYDRSPDQDECPLCAERAARLAAYLEQVLPLAEADHETFLKGLQTHPPTSVLRIHPHALKRQIERMIGIGELRDLVETGIPMEWFAEGPQWRKILLVGETVNGRLLHVVCGYDSARPDAWYAITAYDPRQGKWWWFSQDGRRRVCFCPPPPDWDPDEA
jgi:hypothetical protein